MTLDKTSAAKARSAVSPSRRLALSTVLLALSALCTRAALPTSGLLLRYETVGSSPLTVSSNRVTAWNNQAGAAKNAIESDANGPTLVTNATPAATAALRFDGKANCLRTDVIAELDGRQTLSWFVVFRKDAGTGENEVLLRNNHRKSQKWSGLWINYGTNLVSNVRDSGMPAKLMAVNEPFSDTNHWHIASAVWNGTTNAANGNPATTIQAWLNGKPSGSRAGADGIPGDHNLTCIGAGANTSAPSEFFSGQIAALLLYTDSLGKADREAVESYLRETYLNSPKKSNP